jgi:hypothetical protein
MRNSLFYGLAATVLVILMAVTGLFAVAISSGGSSAGTLATGRSVQVKSDSIWLSCQYAGDAATIRTAGKTLVVAPRELLVDGRHVARLKPDAKSIVITAERGDITLVADGTEVSLAPAL